MAIKTFARRIVKQLSTRQKEQLENILPTFLIDTQSDFLEWSKQYNKIFFEIGFGNGEYIIEHSIQNQDVMHIGCEPLLNGVTRVLDHISQTNAYNIRLYTDDARVLLESMPDNIIDQMYIICPDPWPKRRHNKRRLINPQFLKDISSKMSREGYLVIVTDHYQYASWIHEALLKTDVFAKLSEDLEYYKGVPKGWLYTKYQKVGVSQGSDIYFFKCYKRLND